jgi:aryl-alcohol dehydrogenase-like predicted oxidoreductase
LIVGGWLGRAGVRAQEKSAQIPRRRLGRTGEQVSLVGLGGYHVGVQKDPQESLRIVRSAIDAGINFLDNCWDYNDGESELRMGRALRDGYRKRAFVMTKIDGRSKAGAARQIDESLRRLQTDYIDLMQIHEMIHTRDAERVFAPGGAVEALLAAKQAGKVRYLGFTGHKSAAVHLHMLDTAKQHGLRFDAVQLCLNVMDAHDPDGFEQRVIPRLQADDIGILGMKSLAGGSILESKTVSATECIQYVMSLPVSSVITGCDSMRALRQSITAAQSFRPWSAAQRSSVLARTQQAAADRRYEGYKISDRFDDTDRNPDWVS